MFMYLNANLFQVQLKMVLLSKIELRTITKRTHKHGVCTSYSVYVKKSGQADQRVVKSIAFAEDACVSHDLTLL